MSTRTKCKDSTSFARQTEEEAEVAALMRAGKDAPLTRNVRGNATGTNASALVKSRIQK